MVGVAERPTSISNYKGMREWLDRVEAIGELRRVNGATWQEDIGRIAEMLTHTDGAPAVICDEIPGYPKGYRVLVNSNGEPRRLAITLANASATRQQLSPHPPHRPPRTIHSPIRAVPRVRSAA